MDARAISIIIFLAFFALIFFLKPKFLVDQETGEWKTFGIGKGKSCINITTIMLTIAFLTYIATLSVCGILNRS